MLLIFICSLKIIAYSINASNIDTDFPIVLSHNSKESSSLSYFGASVTIAKGLRKSDLIVGAPKYNGEDSQITGAIFTCDIDQSSNASCRESNFVREDKTKNMNLGASVTSQAKELLFCAPTWTNKWQTGNDFPSGLCYLITDQGETHRLSPFENPFYQLKHDTSEYYYSDALAGTSSVMKESMIAIGAPGFSDWQGSVVIYNKANFATASILFVDHNYDKDFNTIMGYSVAIGQFFYDKVNYIATGAPRSKETGCVYIFRADDRTRASQISLQASNRLYKYFLTLKKCGDQFLEYFGASVLAIDVNKDRLTDLIVGAPLYSPSTKQRGDVGRIFVYLSRGSVNSFESPTIISIEKNYGARFGSALASIGDLNYDGFKDIAVGAPYENEGHGAVYIYHGTRFGLSKNYIQRIAAADQLSAFKLRGFGLSIATGHDVDNNDYPDLLIGSYMSDKAVLLRSRPVMSIKLSIKFNLHKSSEEIAQIDLKNQNCQLNSILYSCFDVVYCLHLKGEYLPKIQNVIVSFEIDSKLKRRGFVKVDENKLHQFNREANVSTKSNQCLEPISIYLDPKTEDKLTPMSISLSAKLNKEEQKSEFCKECPILSNEASISRNLDFETGCGIDQHCTADLRLDVRSNLSFILQGLNTEFPLYVQITNKGENAYSTKLQLAIQPAIDVNQISSYCEEHIEHEMVKINCDINNPLEEEQSKEIFFLLGLSKLSSTTQSITVDANVTTVSDLSEESQTRRTFILDIKRFALLFLMRGEMLKEEFYSHSNSREIDYLRFSSLLQVVKENYSSVDEVVLTIRTPSFVRNHFISFQPRVILSNKPSKSFSLKCEYLNSNLPMLPEDLTSDDESEESDVEMGNLKMKEEKVSRREAKLNEDDFNANTTAEKEPMLKLNCDTTDCETVRCQMGPFGFNQQTALLEIKNAINLTSVERLQPLNYSSILLSIEVDAKIADESLNSENHKIFLPIVFKRIPTQEPVSSWVVFASSGIGLVLFVIIFILLLKFGFFQRKQHEELQRFMRENRKRDAGATDNISETNHEPSTMDQFL